MSTYELVRIGNQTEDGFLFSASCIIINRRGKTWTTATVTFPTFTHFSVEPSESKNDYVVTLYEKRLELVSPEKAHKDPKTRLQEFMQSRQKPLPVYELMKVEGEAHAQFFYVLCQIEGMSGPISGKGKSRRKAEQDAARKAYDMITTQQN